MSNIREWHALTTSRDAFPTVPRADIQRIKPPVMMLSGGRTLELLKLVDAELEPLLANGERVVLPNSTHEMWAEQPEESRRAVLAFLAKHSQ
jgi:pimeloyl-ACP methyl ester carboxylesterase